MRDIQFYGHLEFDDGRRASSLREFEAISRTLEVGARCRTQDFTLEVASDDFSSTIGSRTSIEREKPDIFAEL